MQTLGLLLTALRPGVNHNRGKDDRVRQLTLVLLGPDYQDPVHSESSDEDPNHTTPGGSVGEPDEDDDDDAEYDAGDVGEAED